MAHEPHERKTLSAKAGALLKSAAFGWILRAFPLVGLVWSVRGAWRRYRAKTDGRQSDSAK